MSRRRSSAAAFSLFSFQDIITSVTGIMILVTLILALDLMDRTIQAPPVATTEAIDQTTENIEEMQKQIDALKQRLQSGVASLANLPSLDATTLERKLKETKENEQRIEKDSEEKRVELDKKEQALRTVKSAELRDKDQEQQTLEDLEQRVDDLTVKLESIESQDRMFFKEGVKGKETWVVEIGPTGIKAGKIGVSAPPRSFLNASSFQAWMTSLNKNKEALYLVIKPGGEKTFDACKDAVSDAKIDFGFTVEPASRQILDPKIGAGTP